MDIMTLAAKLTMDSGNYEKGLRKAESSFSKLGQTISAKTVALGTMAGNLLTSASSKAFNAVKGMISGAIDSYAEFEQLVGGVETLLGTRGAQSADEYGKMVHKGGKAAEVAFKNAQKAQELVFKNADEAYKTAGISANRYMETATSFAASLVQSLGGDTKRAAELTDIAIQDMSDNANKMGSAMESVENAYKGFSKGNFTMLDNLKLGYGGTKEEMERLLKDASQISKKMYDISRFSDIVDAIHVIQQSKGITGTTAKEAADTINGSRAMMQAAWENVLTSFVTNGAESDIKKKVKILTDTAKTYLDNLLPTASAALDGLSDFLTAIMPDVMEKVPEIILKFGPKILKAGETALKGLGRGLKNAAKKIKLPTWSDVKETVSKTWTRIQQGVQSLGGFVFGRKKDGSVNWPTWETVKDKASKAWETIKAEAKNLAGLVFGKKEDGSVDWPTWEDVANTATEVWKNIKAEAKKLAGLVFGTKEDGSVDWPTWEDVVSKATEAWEKIKAEAKKLAGLVLGTKEDGSVDWPTWDEIKEKLTADWNTIVDNVKKLPGLVFGEDTVISGALENALTFIQDVGTWIINNWEVVALGIGSIIGAFAIDKLMAINPVLAAIAVSAGLIITNWEKVKKIVDDVAKVIEDAKTKIEEVNRIFLALQNGGETKLASGQISDLLMDMKKAAKTGNYDQFYKNLESNMKQAGFDAVQIEAAINAIKSADDPEWVASFIKSLGDANTAASVLQELINTLTGDHDVNIHINTIGDLPEIPSEPIETTGGGGSHGFAKGLNYVPYNDYVARLHRGEMVLSASQARRYRNGESGNNSDIVGAIQQMRNDLQNLKLVVGERTFGRAVVDYGGSRMNGYIGQSDSRMASGYGA